jgi:hypothetical protein
VFGLFTIQIVRANFERGHNAAIDPEKDTKISLDDYAINRVVRLFRQGTNLMSPKRRLEGVGLKYFPDATD